MLKYFKQLSCLQIWKKQLEIKIKFKIQFWKFGIDRDMLFKSVQFFIKHNSCFIKYIRLLILSSNLFFIKYTSIHDVKFLRN